MIDAVTYGMIPSAKSEKRDSAEPEKRFRSWKTPPDPPPVLKNCFRVAWSTPGAALLVTSIADYPYAAVIGAYVVAALVTLVPSALELLEQPNSAYHMGGYAIAAFALVVLAWPLIRWQTAAQ